MRVAIVEDEKKLADSLAEGITTEGCEVRVFYDGETALEDLAQHHAQYAIAIIDLALPGIGGLDVCRQLRAGEAMLPIIVLTARNTTADKVEALDSGADDFITKPFSFDELLARMRAILRRSRDIKPAQLQAADVILDTGTREVRRSQEVIRLTYTEFELLRRLMEHAGKPLTRDEISALLWNTGTEVFSNAVDVHIRNLRKKIDDNYDTKIIRTVRGVGYAIQG